MSLFQKILFSLFLLLMSSIPKVEAQSLKAYVKAADNALQQEDYFTALIYYRKVLEVEPERLDVYFKYAESARLLQAYRVAEEAYQNITESKDASRFPLALYWLGSMKKNLGDYQNAKNLFESYLKKYKRVNSRFAFRAEKDIADCTWASRNFNSSNNNVQVKAVEGNVNSPYSEFGAFELDDELYFTSMRFMDEKNDNRLYSKLMIKNKANELETVEWGDGKYFTANAAIDMSGKTMFYTLCKFDKSGDIKCKILYKERDTYGGWGLPKELPTYINFPGYTSTHPTIGYDMKNEKQMLIFSSNRPGGKGKMDLWYSYLDPTGKYTRPVNMAEFNTRENEVTPYFHSPSQVLFYSSDGYQGMGGYDIYKARKDDSFWKKPTHMGFPINSSYNDFYFTLDNSGSKTYFSSNRAEALEIDPENEACCNDIFTAEIKPDEIIFKPEIILAKEEAEPAYPIVEVESNLSPSNNSSLPSEEIGSFENNSNQEDNKESVSEVLAETMTKPNTNINTPKGSDSSNTFDPNDVPETVIGNGNIEIADTKIKVSKPSSKSKSKNTNFDIEALPENIYKLSFEALTYNMDAEPLDIAKVEFIELQDGVPGLSFYVENFSSNSFLFKLKHGMDYKVVLTSPGYVTEERELEKELLDASALSLKFYLMVDSEEPDFPVSPLADQLIDKQVTESTLEKDFPIALFFNDDEPDPKSWSPTTNNSYEQTYIFFYNQKNNFKSNYAKSFRVEVRENAANEVEDFFENEVKLGYNNLKEFSDNLLKFLNAGNTVEIKLQSTSTTTSSNAYNSTLMKRRTSCVSNHFNTYLGGRFLPFLESGTLKIKTISPIQNTSIKPGSKYGPEISRIRKVEIVDIKINGF